LRACAWSASTSPSLGQDGRVDAAGQVSQVLEGFIRLGLELLQCGARLIRVPVHEHLGQPHLDLERDQVLLCAIVQVALQPSSFLVLRPDQPLTRGAQLVEALQQLGGEADVLEHQPRLVREVLEQL